MADEVTHRKDLDQLWNGSGMEPSPAHSDLEDGNEEDNNKVSDPMLEDGNQGALCWSKTDPFNALFDGASHKWKIVEGAETTQVKDMPPPTKRLCLTVPPNKHSDIQLQADKCNNKQKMEESPCSTVPKKQKSTHIQPSMTDCPLRSPEGLIWDDNSCAFDAFFTILINLCKDNNVTRYQVLCEGNDYFKALMDQFAKVKAGITT
ncbi:hypothetical protein K439DRAFT_1620707 [Ramaria rubella]|nr:hypothetical protein K439DRAFT_1620707 [Ramaria rubella]